MLACVLHDAGLQGKAKSKCKAWPSLSHGQEQMDAKMRFLANEENDHGILCKSEDVMSIRV